MKGWMLLALLLATPTAAQDVPVESLTVYGNSLAGVWRVSRPDTIAATGFLSAPKFGPPRQSYCRIAPRNDASDALAAFCTDAPVASVTVEENHVHLAWGTMLLRFVMDGEIESDQRFRGRFQVKAAGVTFENPDMSEAVRLTPDVSVPDGGGKQDLLRRVLEQGVANVSHDGKYWGNNLPETPKLGPVSAIAYIGQETWEAATRENRAPPLDVYLVRFAQGERLCALHQRGNGVLDAFFCR
jgi:hypothetical protein